MTKTKTGMSAVLLHFFKTFNRKKYTKTKYKPVPLKMLLDKELFIPKAWLRFIPNPDMLWTQQQNNLKQL